MPSSAAQTLIDGSRVATAEPSQRQTSLWGARYAEVLQDSQRPGRRSGRRFRLYLDPARVESSRLAPSMSSLSDTTPRSTLEAATTLPIRSGPDSAASGRSCCAVAPFAGRSRSICRIPTLRDGSTTAPTVAVHETGHNPCRTCRRLQGACTRSGCAMAPDHRTPRADSGAARCVHEASPSGFRATGKGF